MKKIYIFILFLILILLTGCKKKQIQIRELDFYDYIYAENTRVKGIPPYHLGEGNPSDWIGRFVYSINTNQICYYYVCIRSDSLVKYGKIIRHIEYKQ